MRLLRRAASIGAAALLAGGAALNTAPTLAATAPTRPVSNAAPLAAAGPTGSWTVYHHDNAHTGYDSSQGPMVTATTGWTSVALDGQIYGEPLVYGGLVYVATLNNTVYALNQSTGAVVWSRNLGAPQTSGWQCGNINPTGTLGTGVIDVAQSRIYVVPFLHSALAYYLVGLDLATGTIGYSVKIKPTGFDWTIQQERGALAISKDGTHVYVPFGGRAGDCGPYHGWVVSMPIAGGVSYVWKSPTTASGIWAAGGVVVDDATGNVFFATGNAIPCSGAVMSDSLIRTNASLGATNYFQPSDWFGNWCAPDLDLGSVSPVLISSGLMFTSGKYGSGFLVDPGHLGGTGGQLFRADVCHGINSDAVFGSHAYAAPYVYLECDGGGIVGVKVNAAAHTFSRCDSSSCASPSWIAGDGLTFGPPIVVGGVVWAIDIGGSGLYGYDALTGAQMFHSAAFGVDHFVTPSEAGGQIFVPAGTRVREFDAVFGCKSVTTSASPTAAMKGSTVVITATANGCPNPNPVYQFWVKAPGSSSYTLGQAYSATNTFGWDTTGLATGRWQINVWAHDALDSGAFSNASGRWDTYNANLFVNVTAGCPSVGATAAPTGAAMVGSTVTITVTAPGCPSPTYEFWVLAPGASLYTLGHAYGASPTFNWDTTGKAVGTWRINVWVHDSSHTGLSCNASGCWDAYNANLTYRVTAGCPTVNYSAAPTSPSTVGTPVVVTATAPGCPQPDYEFWVLAPGASLYTLGQAYSASNTFSWDTTSHPTGTYRITVWVRDHSHRGIFSNSSGSWDAYNASLLYTLT